MGNTDVLDLSLPPVRQRFRDRLSEPTPHQLQGWPDVANREYTLILAPTGSGKTIAAFLACLDALWLEAQQEPLGRGVRVLYISPLKALNHDIHRNLQFPLEGVTATAARMGTPLPALEA